MTHLPEATLALAARNELDYSSLLRVKAHCFRCPQCRARMAEYRTDKSRVAQGVAAFSLPRTMDWSEMETEIFANIRLGVEVDSLGPPAPSHVPRGLPWRGLAAAAALTAIVVTGWFLSGPGSRPYLRSIPPEAAQIRSGALLLRADETGVGLETKGQGLILRSAAASRLEVGLEGSLRSSNVDLDSGQITVSQIYVD